MGLARYHKVSSSIIYCAVNIKRILEADTVQLRSRTLVAYELSLDIVLALQGDLVCSILRPVIKLNDYFNQRFSKYLLYYFNEKIDALHI